VPLHINAYFPEHDFDAPPTSVEFLERAHDIARDAGIKFAYVGNVDGHRLANTYCPQCGELLLERWGGKLERDLTDGYNCVSCGFTLPLV
jgi:pyruvate formate lyase activating enzyme